MVDPLPEVLTVTPPSAPPRLAIRPPGSKSITNRALLCAALAPARSRLRGVLFADDTRAMLEAIVRLGAVVEVDEAERTVTVTGAAQRPAAVRIDARQSGTTSRFVLPAIALSAGPSVLDGGEQLRRRPFAPLAAALRQLGAGVESADGSDRLPLTVTGPATGRRVEIAGDLSSQFVSGLLLAAPLLPEGLEVRLSTPLVSAPYLDLTRDVMRAFGASVEGLTVQPGGYRGADFEVEPDASAASYFLAAAAITGGRVTIEGLGTSSRQGDVRFAELMERMGATVERGADRLTVTGPARLHGIDVDMADISDTAQTLAAVAPFAEGPTRVRGIGFIRAKETDRIAAIVAELRRAGIRAEEHEDGFTVQPGTPQPTVFQTYDDHRMAMSFALIGLRAPGIRIADPGCVAKTYPAFFDDLAGLVAAADPALAAPQD